MLRLTECSILIAISEMFREVNQTDCSIERGKCPEVNNIGWDRDRSIH